MSRPCTVSDVVPVQPLTMPLLLKRGCSEKPPPCTSTWPSGLATCRAWASAAPSASLSAACTAAASTPSLVVEKSTVIQSLGTCTVALLLSEITPSGSFCTACTRGACARAAVESEAASRQADSRTRVCFFMDAFMSG